MIEKKVGLLCVTHDPQGKNLELIRNYSKELRDIYKDLFITVSDETDERIISELQKNNFKVKVIQKLGAANARREVVKFGLTGSNDYFHYCDFDRLLTWVNFYPSELKSIVQDISNHNYLILGRTEHALNTHPIEWVETEKITNRITSLELNQEVDITAGSCGLSRESAKLIFQYSKAKMTDAEWPMIVKRIGNLTVSYKAVEGLLYNEDINGINNQKSESEKWLSRIKLCCIISESAVNTGK